MTNAEVTKALADARKLLLDVTGVALHAPTAVDLTTIDHVVGQIERALREGFDPIPMVLWCPVCGRQHVDMVHASDPGWTNPPHRSHKCASCDHVWRPADVATTGVPMEELQTRGEADVQPPERWRVRCAKLSSYGLNGPGSEDRLVEHLQSHPVLTARVLARLRVLGPWRQREANECHRGGADMVEWERVDLVTGRYRFEVYHDPSWMREVGAMADTQKGFTDDEVVMLEGGHTSIENAKLAADAIAQRKGWVLTYGTPG